MNRYHVAAVTNLEGDWRLDGYQKSVIELKKLLPLLINERLENIKLDDIAWKGKDLYPQKSGNNCYCCAGKKYRDCDTKYPLIIAKNALNPFNNKYRMIIMWFILIIICQIRNINMAYIRGRLYIQIETNHRSKVSPRGLNMGRTSSVVEILDLLRGLIHLILKRRKKCLKMKWTKCRSIWSHMQYKRKQKNGMKG